MTLRDKLDEMTTPELRELHQKIQDAREREVARRAALKRFSGLVLNALRRKKSQGART